MDLARDHFLADAALAAQQHADVVVGDAIDHRHHRLHRLAGAPARLRAVGILADLRAQALHFVGQRQALERVADRGFERDFADAVGVAGLDARNRWRRGAPLRQSLPVARPPDSITTCAAGCARRICRSVSRPSRPGIDTSSRTTSGSAPSRSPLQQRVAAVVGRGLVAARPQQGLQVLRKRLDRRRRWRVWRCSCLYQWKTESDRRTMVLMSPRVHAMLLEHERRPNQSSTLCRPSRNSPRRALGAPGPACRAASRLRRPGEHRSTRCRRLTRTARGCFARFVERRLRDDRDRAARDPRRRCDATLRRRAVSPDHAAPSTSLVPLAAARSTARAGTRSSNAGDGVLRERAHLAHVHCRAWPACRVRRRVCSKRARVDRRRSSVGHRDKASSIPVTPPVAFGSRGPAYSRPAPSSAACTASLALGRLLIRLACTLK